MDYTLAIGIQSLIKSGNNTVQNVYSNFGSDVIESAINEGYLSKGGNLIFLTQKGMSLTRPVESNNAIDDGKNHLLLS
jgi:hypothetical protein